MCAIVSLLPLRYASRGLIKAWQRDMVEVIEASTEGWRFQLYDTRFPRFISSIESRII